MEKYHLDPNRYVEFEYLCFLDINDVFVENYVRFHLGTEKPIFRGRLASHIGFWRE